MPERGIARIILLSFMLLFFAGLALFVVAGERWRDDEFARRTLRIDRMVAREASDVRKCLSQRSGVGLALGPRRGGPPHLLNNNAKHMNAAVEESSAGTRVRLWLRDDYELSAKDHIILARCLGR